MPLIKNAAWAEDSFARIADHAALPDGPVLVSLPRFLAERDSLLARNAPLGVALACSESPEALGADAQRLTLIVIAFPGFKDGRGFSLARLLRTRLGYRGALRATGHFLADQLAFLARVGFDEFDGDDRITPAALTHALGEISHVYQPSADSRKPIWLQRRLR